MKFTKKMVEVIERQIGRKLTADEIERGAVKETVKTWSSSKVVSIRRKSNKHLERQAVDFCKREIAGVRSACSSSAAGTISRRCDIRGGRAG